MLADEGLFVSVMFLSFRIQMCALGTGDCLFFKLSGTAKHPLPRPWKVYTREICAREREGGEEERKKGREREKGGGEGT